MPRELYLLTPEPVSFEVMIAAAAEVDDQLLLRGLYGGAALQLVGADDRAVLTIENSRRLADLFDPRRVTPDFWNDPEKARAKMRERDELDVAVKSVRELETGIRDNVELIELGEAEVWWTEATAPWGAVGDPGVAVIQGVARALGGQLRVEDGT